MIIDIDQLKLDRLRVQILYQQSLLTQSMGLINAGIFCFISKDYVPNSYLLGWFCLATFVFLLRFTVQKYFYLTFQRVNQSFEPHFWENVFVCGTFLSGFTWSLAGTWLLPDGVTEQHAFLGFLLAGTTAGACVAYSVSMPTIYAFLLPSVLPFVAKLLMQGHNIHYGMALLLLLYVITISGVMSRISQSVISSIRLRFEKDQLLRELHEAQAKITQSAKMVALGEMAGGLAHEINTPLGTLLFEIDTLDRFPKAQDIDSASIKNIAGRMSKLVVRISKLVNGLLVFAQEMNREGFDMVLLQKMVPETLDFCRSRFRNNNIELEVGPIPESLWIFTKGMQMREVLLNLLNNAFDAVVGKPSAKVRIEVEVKSKEIRISVVDNGPGVAVDIRDKIMEPFFTTKTVGDGTGMGLSVSRGLVQAHGGRLEFETSDTGSCFTVILPNDPKLNVA